MTRDLSLADSPVATPSRNLAALLLAAVILLGLGGCATAQKPDPLEPFNRAMFSFNDAVDGAVVKPVATVYSDVVPRPVRKGVTNFYNNLRDAWSAINLLLQARPVDAVSDLARFGTNTVFGVLGVFDVASDLGLERHGEDIGQTLGRWGVGPGAYIVWPVFGPSTVRDTLNIPLDSYFSPATYVSPPLASLATTGFGLINLRANLLGAGQVLDDIALDKYTFVRNAYLQRRRSQVYDGNPPEETYPTDLPDYSSDLDPADSAAPATPASAPAPAAAKPATGPVPTAPVLPAAPATPASAP